MRIAYGVRGVRECGAGTRRMVQVLPNGPLLDYPQAFGEPSQN